MHANLRALAEFPITRFLVVAGLLALLVGSATVARAQPQAITIDNLQLTRTGGIYLPATHRGLMFAVQQQDGATQLRQYVFARTLSQPLQQQVRLPGRYELIGTASSRHHVLYQLRRRGYDTLLTVAVDTLGQLVAPRRDFTPGLPGRSAYMSGAAASQTDGFLLTESGLLSSSRVRFLDPQLRQCWQHAFTSPKGRLFMETAIMDSTYVWLLVTTNARSRLAITTAYCLELATGHVTCRLPLDYEGQRRVPGTASMGPGHSLLVAGYSYATKRPNRAKTGRLFITRLHPDSTRRHDYQVALTPEAHQLTTAAPKVLWQALRPAADGSVQLVGETYTSTSAGGNFAINVVTGLATLGLFRLSATTLRPRGVVSLRMLPTGQLRDVRVLALPEGGSFTLGGYWPARSIAPLARQAGVFRVRGFATDSQRLVLRTEQRILTIALQSGMPLTVKPMPRYGHSDVWFIEPQNLVLYNEQRGPQRIELKRVAY